MSTRTERRKKTKADLESRLAGDLIVAHPTRAASALERLGLSATREFAESLSNEQFATLLPLFSPQFGTETTAALGADRIADLLARIPVAASARIVRLLGDRGEAPLARLEPDRAHAIQVLLRYPDDTAGGLMDPYVLALPDDLTAAEALERVRDQPQYARYNINVVDHEQTLVGVINLRELFVAPPNERLANRMVLNPYRLEASTQRAEIIAHPGWREAHSLPVVDSENRYLGTIRYKTLRSLEDEQRARRQARRDNPTAGALGELFAVGAEGMMQALIGGADPVEPDEGSE